MSRIVSRTVSSMEAKRWISTVPAVSPSIVLSPLFLFQTLHGAMVVAPC